MQGTGDEAFICIKNFSYIFFNYRLVYFYYKYVVLFILFNN
ncbi:hypothetical protein CLOBOL_04943 [Enterocloster bolteae ATCC BAA-613]|uniref:Uncharacterized protein n=1 Tax=Enterocloster bolteae (strain ATCC BAA-613 / DSM 15670 / CCUG 46953 / JCM 12243 / WAL 16351) TaxID=411902 RepID=A8RXT4_ENTBW|nr:hypothetical protein CLOBOL_04943 [Enterocloster bolteae ATCC BAA-613]